MGRRELIEYLFKLSEGKLFLMKQLLTLTQQQSEGLESKETDILNDIIEQKQSIINRVDILDKEFVSKYDLLKNEFLIDENTDSLQYEDKDKIRLLQDKIKEIQILTEKIQQIDKMNVERLRQNMSLIKSELKKVKFGKKVSQGYSNKVTDGISIFVDKKQ